MARRPASPPELLEYHEAPPALVRDMERWLAVGDRRAAAESVRRWLVESYALGPVKAEAAVPRSPARRARRTKK